MENQSRAVEGSSHAADPPDRTLEDERHAAGAVHEELMTMGMPRVNLLLTGKARAVQDALESLAGNLHEPIVTWCPGEQLALPVARNAGTMVLHNIDAMRLEEQVQLLAWLGEVMGRTQVVSTSAAPLLPQVRAGAFLDTLYYRLNTVYVPLAD